MNRYLAIATLMVLAMSLAACGGGKAEAKTSGDASAEADVEPMDQLKGISTSLQASVDTLMQPINDVDGLINDITSLPTKLNLDAASLMGMFSAQASSDGKIEISADITTDDAVKAEIEAVMERLRNIIAGLKAIPTNVKLVTVQAAEAVVALPVLATKVTASANAKIVNPFGKAEEKAQAQADLTAVAGVQTEIQGQISDIQAQITGIPAMGAEALAKITAAFAGGASAGN